MQELSQQELKRQLHYDQFTGIFTRLICKSTKVKVGDVAGGVSRKQSGKKYINISINNKLYKAHRLAVLYMTGEFPTEDTDHENGNGLDNWWTNLRCATKSENNKNQRLPRNNTSGFIGVHFSSSANKWESRVMINGKKLHLGYFTDINAAISARQEANILHGFHINHGQTRPL